MQSSTREEIINHLLQDPFYEQVLTKYLANIEERNEFRQEMWVILLEMPEEKLFKYYKEKTLKYIYIGIINNQLKSNTSPWHKKFRKPMLDKVNNMSAIPGHDQEGGHNESNDSLDYFQSKLDDTSDIIQLKEDFEFKIEYIEDKLDKLEQKDPWLKRDISIFKMHYYDKLSYSKIKAKTRVSVPSIFKYVNNVLYLLRKDKPKIK